MNLLATMRHKRKPWGVSSVALFVAVWLNIALQPCLMALESDDDHCPHCPPQVVSDHAGHGMATEIAEMPAPCAAATDCTGDFDHLLYDGRTVEAEIKKSPDVVLAIVPAAISECDVAATTTVRHLTATLHHSGAPPPLSILYCVFLN